MMSEDYLSLEDKILNKTYIYQFVPDKFYEFSKEEKFIYRDKKLKTMYIIDIIHSFMLNYYSRKEITFTLNAIVMKKKYGKYYNLYVEYLIEEKAIAMVKNYSTGNSSRVYIISNDILSSKIHRIKNEDINLLKRYKDNVLESLSKIKHDIILPDIKYKLINDLYDVDIDIAKSKNILLDEDTQDSYNMNIYSIESISNKNIFTHFDNYGRMHTNFTILKSKIRKECITINGNPIVELDIKNSQPLFLCKVIDNNKFSDYNLDTVEYSFYRHLTHSGQLYQYIIDNSEFMTKKDVKDMVYKVLFGRNTHTRENIIFNGLFPNIFGYIRHFKKVHNDYKSMSHILQKMESELVFNKIIKSIIKSEPNIKIITIHDSIIFEKKYERSVSKIFEEIIKNEFKHENILSTK